MQRYTFCILFLVTLLFFSCQQDQKHTKKPLPGDCVLDTRLSLEFHSVTNWGKSYKICQSAHINGRDVLVGYHHTTHQLQLWDLSKEEKLYAVPLSREGPNSMPEVVSFYFHNEDSIFILSFFSIALIDKEGSIKWIEKINKENSPVNGDDINGQFTIWSDINHSSPLYYDKNEKALYFAFKPFYPDNQFRFQQSMCGRLLLSGLKMEPLPIYLPVKYRDAYFGSYERASFRFFEDGIVYCFYSDPDIYHYDKRSGKITIHQFKAKHISKLVPTISKAIAEDDPAFARHVNEHPTFFKTSFSGNIFYRCYIGPLTPGAAKRGKYMMTFDKNFNLLTDTPLPDDVAILASNVTTSKGLLFYKIMQENEDMSQYLIAQVNCEESN